MNTDNLRHRLMKQGLSHQDLNSSPVKQFENWYQDTVEADIYEPGAMSLATVDNEGQPWQRIVLLKLFDEEGFVFFTNYESRKANQLAVNSNVSLLFPWHVIGRQVIITGEVEKISTAESLNYFSTRPRGSQIGAWSSGQSQLINSRSILETMVDSMKKKFKDKEVPLPPFWGGYRVKPKTFQFLQARDSSLHDSFNNRNDEKGKLYSNRMAP
mgnify:CR=1 FL=1